jgi:hypothetical protein
VDIYMFSSIFVITTSIVTDRGASMKGIRITAIFSLALMQGSVWGDSTALDNYTMLTTLNGDWMLSPAEAQQGGATTKGSAAELIGTDKTAISFKVVGKGSAVQENLLPGTSKEMVSMYHCNDFKNCTQVQAKHSCAKQNQPELVLDPDKSNDHVIVMTCNMDTSLCNSTEEHVHAITHELSKNNNRLKTTYTIYSDGNYKYDSIYHFDRKD